MIELSNKELKKLAAKIKKLGMKVGFQQIGIAGIQLAEDEKRLQEWLARKRHGEMSYMGHHNKKRAHPEKLVPDTLRVISARMNYWSRESKNAQEVLDDQSMAYISRYAVGRDYHKVIRQRLKMLALGFFSVNYLSMYLCQLTKKLVTIAVHVRLVSKFVLLRQL